MTDSQHVGEHESLGAMPRQRNLADFIASVPEANRWKLDREIDFENRNIQGHVIPQHLGRIASIMTDWHDSVADQLGLTNTNKSDIMEKYARKPVLQRYM